MRRAVSFKEWWAGLSPLRKWGPLALAAFYVLVLAAFRVLSKDHCILAGFGLGLAYGGKLANDWLKLLLPVLLTTVVYDSQRYFADFLRGPIRVAQPYQFDKFFFGIRTTHGVLTPNEWWQLHTYAPLDLISGAAYLIFVPVFIAFGAYFYFRRSREKAMLHMWAFFIVNMLGYSTYYWYPAAPPWYVAEHGLGPALLGTPPSLAGCARFDALLGIGLFSQWYGRSADVFGAIPSLHVAYPLITVLFAYQLNSLFWLSLSFYLLMCFSAVYLNHHYILDILWGSAYAVFCSWLTIRTSKFLLDRKERKPLPESQQQYQPAPG